MIRTDGGNYNIIDISKMIVPDGTHDRPFVVKKSLLHDDTFKYDVYNTHTHVGTHVECSSHFFEDGRSVEQYGVEEFCGRGVLFHVDLPDEEKYIYGRYIEEQIGEILNEGDIVVCRNEKETKPKDKKYFTDDAARYFARKKVKMIALGTNVSLGDGIEMQRLFHDIVIENTVLLENLDNLSKISKKTFFVMACPILVKGLDSGWCRAVVIEEKD